MSVPRTAWVFGESVEAITGVKTSPETHASAAAEVTAIVAKKKMARRISPKIFLGFTALLVPHSSVPNKARDISRGSFRYRGKRLENLHDPVKVMHVKIDIAMAHQPTESKRLLSHVIADWACSLKYEHLSPEAIQAAKLFWFDSIGCALGGSQQDDATILLKHYRAMGGGNGKATIFVSGFKTNPVDASFLNGHMIRAMDYNDIYWKADPCHPSDLIAAPLALCESEGLGGKDLILATIIAYEN